MLKFEDHVNELCKEAPKQLAVWKRLEIFVTKQGKLAIYHSFIAWYFCSASNTNKLEKFQEKALRFINEDYPLLCKIF